MAVSVTGALQLLANITDIRTAVGGAAKESGQRTLAGNYSWAIATGTGINQADKVWADTRSVAAGVTDTIDLTGVLLDSFGGAMNLVKVRGVLVAAALTNTVNITVWRPGANGVGVFNVAGAGTGSMGAGGMYLWADPAAGQAVTGGTGDLLAVTNGGGVSASYDIMLVGTSA